MVFCTYLQHVFMNLIESYKDEHYLTQIRLNCHLRKSWLIELFPELPGLCHIFVKQSEMSTNIHLHMSSTCLSIV